MKFPERSNTGVNAFLALEQFAADARVADIAVLENGSRYSDRALSVVSGLADSPLSLGIAKIPRDRCPRHSLEPTDPVRIPPENPIPGQRLGLLADGVTGCDALQARENAPFDR